jgi:hypothetical protein
VSSYFIDPDWGGTASGTFALPWTTYASLPALSAGDKALLKEGTTFLGRVAVAQSGSAGNPIIFGVYRASDGAQITSTLGAATVQSNADGSSPTITTAGRSHVELWCLKATPAGGAHNSIRLGSGGSTDGNFAYYCQADSASASGIQVAAQTGPVGGGASYCQATGCGVNGCVLGDASADFDGLVVERNNFSSNTGSGIRWNPSAAEKYITGTSSISYNTCNDNVSYGIRMTGDVTACTVQYNICLRNISGMYIGVFAGTVNLNASLVQFNTCNYNVEFGIQTASSNGWLIQYNDCSYNGSNTGNKYGRGIEIFGVATRLSAGTVQHNTCNYNYNYGGTADNGTEGVGIGLDDYHGAVICQNNWCEGNEGNGIQPNPTGSSGAVIRGNVLKNNFLVDSARASGWAAVIKSQIYTGLTELNLSITGNTFIDEGVATCLEEIAEASGATLGGFLVQNNTFIGGAIGTKMRAAATRLTNSYWNVTKPGEEHDTTSALSAETGRVTANPMCNSLGKPRRSSPLLGAGTHITTETDINGNTRTNPPAIGAYDAASAGGGGGLGLRFPLR